MKESILDLGLFDEAVESLADEWYPEGVNGNGVESSQSRSKRCQLKVKETIKCWVGEMEEGFNLFLEIAPDEIRSKLLVLREGDALVDVAEALAENDLVLTSSLDLTDEDMEELYALACHTQEKDPTGAQKLFICLLFFDYLDVRYWLALAYGFIATSQEMMAKTTYEIALVIGLDDPLPYLYYAKFLMQQGDPLALLAVEEGIERAHLHPEEESTLEELEILKSELL